ncbi:required for excision 1-B domain-containing protein [Glossophaga mutica]
MIGGCARCSHHTRSCGSQPEALCEPGRRRNGRGSVTQAFASWWEVLGVKAELASPRAQRLLACHVRSLQLLQQTLATCRCPLLQSLISIAVACRALLCALKQRETPLGVAFACCDILLAAHPTLPPAPRGPAAIMGAPELRGQENTLQLTQLMMKVIKTMEAVSEVLQDLRFDAESAE